MLQHVEISLNEELHKRLNQLAESMGVNLSDLVIFAIQRYVVEVEAKEIAGVLLRETTG